MSLKKNKVKFLYKHLINLKENIKNDKKVLKFKAKKWIKFNQIYRAKLKRHKFKKLKDQTQYFMPKYTNQLFSYKNRYKQTMLEIKKIKLLFGKLKIKKIKNSIKIALKKTNQRITFFYFTELEKRLDVALYWAKFAVSIRNAWQLIAHKKIFINNKLVTIKSYCVKKGDFIWINPIKYDLIQQNIKNSENWLIPPKHLVINYKTLEIIFVSFTNKNLPLNFFQQFNLEKLTTNYYQI